MKFDAGTRTRLLVKMTLDFDPTGSTVELYVDGVPHAATWIGDPVASPGKWTQTARTTGWFAGPDAAAAGATTVLAVGRHVTRTQVTTGGGDVIPADSSPIEVT